MNLDWLKSILDKFDKIQKYQYVLHVVGNPIDSFTLNFDPYFYKLLEYYIQTGKKKRVDYKK